MSSSHFGRLKPSMEGSIQISRDLCWLYLQVMEMFILPYALPLQCYIGSSLLVYQLNPEKIMKHTQLNSHTLRIDQESK